MTNPRPLIAILRGIAPSEILAACEALVGAGIVMIRLGSEATSSAGAVNVVTPISS